MSMCNCNQGRMPCTCKPGRTRHPLVNIAEWRKGCSCAPVEFPVQCEACTEGLILAVETWFTQRNTKRGTVVDNILENLDGRAAEADSPDIAGDAATLIRELDAELYAAQDQIEGLQELMRVDIQAVKRTGEDARVTALLGTAVRYLVAQADADEVTEHYASGGSPHHGHNVPGRWDGDRKHPKGSLCEECAAWNILRQYAAGQPVDIHGPQPMDSAPTDGTRILINTEVHHYVRQGPQRLGRWTKVGTQWIEAWYSKGQWAEWCGNEATQTTNTLSPVEWAPLPVEDAQ